MHDVLTQPGTVLLDTARTDAENRASLLFSAPVRVLEAHAPEDVPRVLQELDRGVADGFHAAGYLAYEAGRAFERVADGPLPPGRLAWFGLYGAPRRLDAAAVETLLGSAAGDAFSITTPSFDIRRAAYREKIGRVKALIREGEVYQINLTGAFDFRFEGAPWAFYAALRARQRVPYGAFVHTGDAHVLSLSPELFFRRAGDRLTARPMKGTIRRGRTWAEDEALRRRLAADEKNRAENLMIVDLLRNDLSVCCRPGTVRVPALFTTELYQSLVQMTSTVEGRLRDGVGYAGLFRALFPCGSVTGAPKIRAMQAIHALEDRPRGVYCGAIGYAAPGGRAVFSVAIRTAVLRGGRGTLGAGSGVVWDSRADAEYDECLLKAAFLTSAAHPPAQDAVEQDFSLIETMCWDGAVRLLDGHAARLRASAASFGFGFDEATFRALVEERTAALDPRRRYRLRVLLGRHGQLSVHATPLAGDAGAPAVVGLSGMRVAADDAVLRHKTTRRDVYDAAYRQGRAEGFDEVLLRNERGEVTEGTRSNVFIRRDGAYLTPPVTSGLLPGVCRQHLLETLPGAAERVLRPADLYAAEAVYVCNAVWGLVPVTLAAPAASGVDAANAART